MYVSRSKNVCKSQNNMKLFVLYSQFINTVFFPPAVLVIMDDLSNFQVFLSFLKCIYTPFKKVSKVQQILFENTAKYVKILTI